MITFKYPDGNIMMTIKNEKFDSVVFIGFEVIWRPVFGKVWLNSINFRDQ